MWSKGTLVTVSGNVNWCSHYGKQYGGSSKNKTTLRSSNSTSEYLSEEDKNTVSKRYTHPYDYWCIIYNSEVWKQSNCPAIDEQIQKMQCMDGILLSHKRVKSSVVAICNNTDLRNIMQSEIKSEKDKYHLISFVCGI